MPQSLPIPIGDAAFQKISIGGMMDGHGNPRRRQLSWQHPPIPRVAGSVVSKAGQIYDSASGTLEEHDHQENATSHLKTLTGNIKAADGLSDPVLAKLCSRCSEVAEELLKALQGMAVKWKHSRS